MEPMEASNLDDQYKYYWEGDLCDHAGQEDGPPLCIRELPCWGRGSGMQGTSEPALLLRAGSGPPESCDIHLASRPCVVCWTGSSQQMSSGHLESSALGLSSKAWSLC